MKGLTAAALLALAVIAPAANINLTEAYPSDAAGNPASVRLGEPFYLTARMKVDGPLTGSYAVRFDLPYGSRTTAAVDFGGDAYVVWGPYSALLAGATPMTVTILPQGDQGSTLTTQFNVQGPTAGIEYFAPRRLSGSVGAFAQLTAGTTNALQWFSPLPSTGGFQQVHSTSMSGKVLNSTPFAQPVVSTPKANSVAVQFETTASAARVNPASLRGVAFNAYRSLPSTASVWLRNETMIQAKSGDMNLFVARTLPSNYKTTMRPFDAVQKLFQGVVAKMQYVTTTARPDATQALRTSRGDCGFFAAAFVGACRNIGVPARAVCGMTAGENVWHVWAEFWMPGFGWIPADPSYADGIVPDGSQPVYFGTIPDLNERVAITYGFDHVAGGKSMPMLQSPMVFWTGGARVSSIQAYCAVRPLEIQP